jgi:hypothetical protein
MSYQGHRPTEAAALYNLSRWIYTEQKASRLQDVDAWLAELEQRYIFSGVHPDNIYERISAETSLSTEYIASRLHIVEAWMTINDATVSDLIEKQKNVTSESVIPATSDSLLP